MVMKLFVALAFVGTAAAFPSPAYLDLEETLFLQQDAAGLKDALSGIKGQSEQVASQAKGLAESYAGVKAENAEKTAAMDKEVAEQMEVAAKEPQAIKRTLRVSRKRQSVYKLLLNRKQLRQNKM